MDLPDLLILRHGETEWNLAHRLQGEMDSPLTDKGRAQAAAQRRILAEVGLERWSLWSSPQGRAMATAQIAFASRAGALRTDPRLCEIGVGAWTGWLRSDIVAAAPHLFESDDLQFYDQAPGGEGLHALHERTGAFLAELTGPAAIVTHGITSRMLRCHALGLDPGAFQTLPGGQGVVFHLSQRTQTCLSEGA